MDDRGSDHYRTVAAAWGRQFWLRARDFRAAIRSVEERKLDYGRLRVQGLTRRVVVRFGECFAGGGIRGAAPIAPESMDPWAVDPDQLRAQTSQIVVCPACEGARKVACP